MTGKLPKIVTTLPGPKARAVIESDDRYISPSYTRSYPLVAKSANLAAGSNPAIAAANAEALAEFDNGLDDDLNTAQALAAVFDFVRKCNIALTEGTVREDDRKQIQEFFKKVDERLGILPPMEDVAQGDVEIDALVAQRNAARKNRDFAMSDRIRDQLLDRGVVIEDTREGTRWRRR